MTIIKESIRTPIIIFVVSVVWQFIVDKEVKWVDNIGVSFMTFLIILLFNWSKKPYKWNKDKDE